MGTLRVTFKLGLAHPLCLPRGLPDLPIVVEFPDTGNTVRIEPPQFGDPTEWGKQLGALDTLTLHVERECPDAEGQDTTYANNERLSINRDAGRAFWLLFEHLRDLESQKDFEPGLPRIVPSYPIAPAEVIQHNPLVRACETEWIYNGATVGPQPFGGLGTVGITPTSWAEAGRRLREGIRVPAYRSFALDACYFAMAGDPARAIIMACAAWEIALREYLRSVTAKNNEGYKRASETLRGIPKLYNRVRIAKGGPLFYEDPDASRESERDLVERLPNLRNKLLHEGATDLPEGSAEILSSAVLDAIDWLFRKGPT
jgi:hypothetical protein